MGRSIPSEAIPLVHPSLALPLLALWIAATVSILASLCASLFRRPKQVPSFEQSPSIALDKLTENADETVFEPPPPAVTATTTTTTTTTTTIATVATDAAIDTECQGETPPPPPPPLPPPPMYIATHGPIPPSVRKSQSRRSHSLRIPEGLKLHEGLSKIRTSRRERHEKTEIDDSLWKKTIILGEKCRVQSDDEEEVPVFDEKGNRQKNYHERTLSSVTISRANSFANSFTKNDSQPT
ncbi:hypothetical protein J5N97_012936 [Dioscorea zingiberensis]|uniref:Uncharacterized protein n=1 Tax=Dioscorea zingiberensis TaxID=325984 RepID=A0A9D5HIK9_9LILI|nr:hypothetical protein J5N97_012936 [Dioscorea zingiberensis]